MEMKRILLKLSGEALAGDKKTGFDEPTVTKVALQVKKVLEQGVQVGIVIGGGNFWRGRTSEKIDRTKADQIGMLATVMNCIYVSEIFRTVGIDTNVYTPFSCGAMTKLFSKDEAVKDLNQNKVVFFAGGMATVLRAIEIEADVVLAARAVDGVYDSDPKTNPNAKKYDRISVKEIVDKKLGIMDLAAAVLSMDNKMPMIIFGLNEEDSIVHTVNNQITGTIVEV